MKSKILAVEFISETHTMVKVGLGDGIYWTKVSRGEGEAIARQLTAELRQPVGDD